MDKLPLLVRPVFLIGMMGSGKTTVGRRLAERRHATFVDLDRRIERIFGLSVAELFGHGEAQFRAHERAALHALVNEPGFAGRGIVVATGGGAVLDDANVVVMRAHGPVVLMYVAPDQLGVRLSGAESSTRPLLSGLSNEACVAQLTSLWHQREPAYRRAATSTVDASGDVETVTNQIETVLVAPNTCERE